MLYIYVITSFSVDTALENTLTCSSIQLLLKKLAFLLQATSPDF